MPTKDLYSLVNVYFHNEKIYLLVFESLRLEKQRVNCVFGEQSKFKWLLLSKQKPDIIATF